MSLPRLQRCVCITLSFPSLIPRLTHRVDVLPVFTHCLSHHHHATTRYNSPPRGCTYLENCRRSRQFQAAKVNACMWPDNGGYYMENPDGTVIAAASDEVCEYA